MAFAETYEAANLVRFIFAAGNPAPDEFPERFWTGEGDLEYALPGESSSVWIGTLVNEQSVLDLSAVENVSQGVAERLVMSVAVGKNADARRHAILERDLGAIEFNLYFIWRERGAADWTYFPRAYKGRLSNSRFANARWNYDVEGRVHDSSRLRSAIWANDNQRGRYEEISGSATADLGFEYLKDLEAGKDLQWPR